MINFVRDGVEKKMRKKKLHMIGSSHIDPVWLWRWQEGFQEIKATFRSALDRISEYNDFIFTCSSAAFYEWVENNAPEMFEEIKQRVKEGKWVIVGGWWVEPDCNIPSGEAFARQALYAQHYFKEKFGITAKTGFNVDSFGHAGTLPQILLKSGLENYVFMRPMPNEKGLPGRAFWWEANDGSKVLAYRLPYESTSWGKELSYHVDRCVKEIKGNLDAGMCFYGVGNHGGGPTKENIESIIKIGEENKKYELVFSSPDIYFDELRAGNAKYPVVHDDLQHHSSGCYSVQSGIKAWNRKSENLLVAAEIHSVIANSLTAQKYREDFKDAWKAVLFNQFHDTLAGTSLEEAYEDARNDYGKAMSIAAANMNHALQSVSWNIDIEEDTSMKPIVVFNSHSWDVAAPVEFEHSLLNEDNILTDEEGNQVPLQTIKSSATVTFRSKVTFIAEVPAFGYRVYKLYSKSLMERKTYEKVKATGCSIENKFYKLSFDAENGYIKSIFDKEEQLEVISGFAAVPRVIVDDSDTWSHEVFKFDKTIGKFKARRIKLAEQGVVKSTISVEYEYENSTIVQEFSLYKDLKGIYVNVIVDWHEKFSMLKFDFPVNVSLGKATYEIPYGYIEKSCNGEEEPGQKWIDFSGAAVGKDCIYGLALANDSKYSYSIEKNMLSMTVLRSPIYAHHIPAVPEEEVNYSFMDQGMQRFKYCLLPHKGAREESNIEKKALELNSELQTVVETYHKGKLLQRFSAIRIDAANIIAVAMKKAEGSEDIIIRFLELYGEKTKAKIELPIWEIVIETEFMPGEIKTFRVKKNDCSIKKVNLIEM
jgi:alpha-mannosidase